MTGPTVVRPFPGPVAQPDGSVLPQDIRGNDNLLAQAVNRAFVSPSLALSVSGTPVTIATPPSGARFGWAVVCGDDGTNGFAEVVAWGTLGASGAVVVGGGTLRGAPAARTYSVSSGALQVALAAGTYAVTAQGRYLT